MISCLILQSFTPFSFADSLAPHKKEIGLWSSVSFNTTSLGSLSAEDVKGRKLLLAGFRYGRALKQSKNFSLFYTLDVIPLAVAFHSSVQNLSEEQPSITPKDVYGFGASPIGFTFCFGTNHKVQPQLGLTGGFLRFQQPVPTLEGTRWNFTASAGGGIRIVLSPTKALDLGYTFHHISNGRRPRENPSLNTNLVYFGFAFL
jgi:hypothetical protein